jgi:hypothetical protein
VWSDQHGEPFVQVVDANRVVKRVEDVVATDAVLPRAIGDQRRLH